MDSFPAYKEIDHPAMPKSHLNSLLIILMMTLFASGLALIILRQIEIYHRDQLYLATQVVLPAHKNNTASIGIKNWQTYRNGNLEFEFRYPVFLQVLDSGGLVNLKHSVKYEYIDPCDFKDGSRKLTEINDFSVSFQVVNINLQGAVESTYFSPKDIIINNAPRIQPGFVDTYSLNGMNGFKVNSGAEGCGLETYYIPLESEKTLVVKRPYDPIRTDLVGGFESIQKNLFSREFENDLFNKILSTFLIIKSSKEFAIGWKIYRNEEYGFEIKYPKNFSKEKDYINLSSKQLQVFFNENNKNILQIDVKNKGGINWQYYSYLDTVLSAEVLIANSKGKVFLSKEGYCDGPACGQPFANVSFLNGDKVYNLTFYGDDQFSVLEEKILSTFKFIQ